MDLRCYEQLAARNDKHFMDVCLFHANHTSLGPGVWNQRLRSLVSVCIHVSEYASMLPPFSANLYFTPVRRTPVRGRLSPSLTQFIIQRCVNMDEEVLEMLPAAEMPYAVRRISGRLLSPKWMKNRLPRERHEKRIHFVFHGGFQSDGIDMSMRVPENSKLTVLFIARLLLAYDVHAATVCDVKIMADSTMLRKFPNGTSLHVIYHRTENDRKKTDLDWLFILQLQAMVTIPFVIVRMDENGNLIDFSSKELRKSLRLDQDSFSDASISSIENLLDGSDDSASDSPRPFLSDISSSFFGSLSSSSEDSLFSGCSSSFDDLTSMEALEGFSYLGSLSSKNPSSTTVFNPIN